MKNIYNRISGEIPGRCVREPDAVVEHSGHAEATFAPGRMDRFEKFRKY